MPSIKRDLTKMTSKFHRQRLFLKNIGGGVTVLLHKTPYSILHFPYWLCTSRDIYTLLYLCYIKLYSMYWDVHLKGAHWCVFLNMWDWKMRPAETGVGCCCDVLFRLFLQCSCVNPVSGWGFGQEWLLHSDLIVISCAKEVPRLVSCQLLFALQKSPGLGIMERARLERSKMSRHKILHPGHSLEMWSTDFSLRYYPSINAMKSGLTVPAGPNVMCISGVVWLILFALCVGGIYRGISCSLRF